MPPISDLDVLAFSPPPAEVLNFHPSDFGFKAIPHQDISVLFECSKKHYTKEHTTIFDMHKIIAYKIVYK
jgi:hypothetical protein